MRKLKIKISNQMNIMINFMTKNLKKILLLFYYKINKKLNEIKYF